MSRYDKQKPILNNSEIYDNLLLEKELKFIKQKPTIEFKNLINNFRSFNFFIHTWSKTDKIYNVSNRYYNSPQYYWAILYMNGYSSPFEIEEGASLFIYYPIESIIK